MTEQSLISSMASDMDYSLGKDVIRINSFGVSSSTSIVLCNSRSWHGILSVYDQVNGCNKVILSTLDDSVLSGDNVYYLSVRKYPGVFFPMGHQYITGASFNPYTSIEYKLGDDLLLRKEMVLAEGEPTLLVRYTLVSARQPVKVRIRPIVAFRFAHELTRCKTDILTGNTPVANGIAYRPNTLESSLYLQTSVESEFITAPDWNYNIEYPLDQQVGKPYQEDLFMPGFFEVPMVSSQEIVLSASLQQQNVAGLANFFRNETKKLERRTSYASCIEYAAKQMIRSDNNGFHVIESMPPANYRSKDICGALAGLTLPNGHGDMFRNVARTYITMYEDGLVTDDQNIDFAPETPLWFIWGVQQYAYQQNDRYQIYREFGTFIGKLLKDLMENRMSGIFHDQDGLLALRKDGKVFYYIEINSMWYNALMFYAELSNSARLIEQASDAAKMALTTKQSIIEKFYDKDKEYFANSFDTDGNKDFTCSPKQLTAYALPYAVADNDMSAKALPIFEKKLLTPVGLRNMDPDDPRYATEGSITPWYLGYLVELYLRVLGRDGIEKAEGIYRLFDTNLNDVLPPSFYESFSPNPPFVGIGSPMSAVTIATINRIRLLIDQF